MALGRHTRCALLAAGSIAPWTAVGLAPVPRLNALAELPPLPQHPTRKHQVVALAHFAVDPLLEGEVAAQASPHQVEHIGLLNNVRFWWLMGALVICVGVGVVKIEVEGRSCQPANEEERMQACEKPVMASSGGCTLADACHLCFCVTALNVSMLIWGVGQEFVMTNIYEDRTGQQELVPSTLFIVLCNRLVCVCFSASLLALNGKPLTNTGLLAVGLPAISNILASWCQYQSLGYISFTLQTTVKSAKLLPVVLVSSLRGRAHTTQDYAEVVVIASALAIFALETEGKHAAISESTEYGLVLLTGLLVFDSFTPHFQDSLFKRFPEVNALQATFGMAAVASVVALAVLSVDGELFRCVDFVVRNPTALLHIAVLSMASTLTQFLISHTIKHFGPVTFTLIATSRQAISVSLSAALFRHHISGLAVTSVALLFGTLTVRALRPFAALSQRRPHPEGDSPSAGGHGPAAGALLAGAEGGAGGIFRSPSRSFMGLMEKCSQHGQLFLCFVGIHVLFCFYSMAQEFMTIHTFTGRVFAFPMFLIAVNRTTGALFAFCFLKVQGLQILPERMHWTLLPAIPNLLATIPQYQALYRIYFPAQTLMKSMKVLPVMLCGRLLKNRTYTRLDYIEGVVITVLVGFFVWDFQLHQGNLHHSHVRRGAADDLLAGGGLMLCYICMDSLTNNLEDYVYQHARVDPGQQMLGIEVVSGVVCWILLAVSGELREAVSFLCARPSALQYVGMLAVASALGTYCCTLTVRLFGPAVLTLLMVSRQIISLVISVVVFRHRVDWLCCLCLVSVSVLILTASLRQVTNQLAVREQQGQRQEQKEALTRSKLHQQDLQGGTGGPLPCTQEQQQEKEAPQGDAAGEGGDHRLKAGG